MRKPETKAYWEGELNFIQREADKVYRMGGFNSYCLMQMRFAYSDGFADISDRIANMAGIRPVTAESHAAWLDGLTGEGK